MPMTGRTVALTPIGPSIRRHSHIACIIHLYLHCLLLTLYSLPCFHPFYVEVNRCRKQPATLQAVTYHTLAHAHSIDEQSQLDEPRISFVNRWRLVNRPVRNHGKNQNRWSSGCRQLVCFSVKRFCLSGLYAKWGEALWDRKFIEIELAAIVCTFFYRFTRYQLKFSTQNI